MVLIPLRIQSAVFFLKLTRVKSPFKWGPRFPNILKIRRNGTRSIVVSGPCFFSMKVEVKTPLTLMKSFENDVFFAQKMEI
jgi:hypothetical protein